MHHQPDLITPALPPLLRVSIVGRLLQPAQLRIATDNSAWLHLLLQQWAPPGAVVLPMQLRHRCGGHEHAQRLLRDLQALGWALAVGHGLRVAGTGAERTLRLHECTGLLAIDPTAAGVPEAAAAAGITPTEGASA